ncbi:MAG: DUF58 domain-containing protein [Anaerolineae bacterium]|nr:DUF58 domain-containing protein [Anaerolineae bacterium]
MNDEKIVTIKLKNRALPILFGFFLLEHLLFPFDGWKILTVGVGGAWLLGFFWAQTLARGMKLKREMRFGWAKVGDLLLERFTLINDGWWAIWVHVTDHSNLPGYEGDKITNVDRRAIKSWVKRSACNSRGLYTLGPTSLVTGDPFGLYEVKIEYQTTATMLVLPPVMKLPAINIAAGERMGEGRPQTYALERTVSTASIREYVPGDNLRAIHWGQSSRRDNLYVRQFDSTHSSDWWIVLDLDRKVQLGKQEKSTEEHGVALAASLADRGLNAGRGVGLVCRGAPAAWLPPKMGKGQHWEIMRALAMIEPGDETLAEALSFTQQNLSQRTSVVLITPAVEGDWIEALVTLVRRGIAVTVFLLDPVSFGNGSEPKSTMARLSALGIRYFLVSRDLLLLPSYGKDQEDVSSLIGSLHKTMGGNGNGGAPNWKALS